MPRSRLTATRFGRQLPRAQLDAGHVAQAHRGAVGEEADDDVAELLRRDEAPLRADSAETEAVRREVQAGVAVAVAELPEKLRIVTVLAAIEEQDLASVAHLLGVPEGTVKSRLHRARMLLAEKLRWLASNSGRR